MGRPTNDFRRGPYKSYSTKKYRNNATIPNDVYFDQSQRRDYRRQPTFKRYHRGQPPRGNHYSRTSNVRGRLPKTVEKPPSPIPGSEEYMVKKIEQTSALIMRQLLSPNDTALLQENSGVEGDKKSSNDDKQKQPVKETVDRESDVKSTRTRSKKDSVYSVEDVYNKIINHIGNLNDGKKKNLINSKQSGYDSVVNHIATHQRLEISRALRMMCSDTRIVGTDESYDFINSIIPDIGIKIEELPLEFIQQLGNAFDTSSCSFKSNQHSCEKMEFEQSAGKTFPEPPLTEDQVVFNSFDDVISDYIKTEPPDDDACEATKEIGNEMQGSLPTSNKEDKILLETIKEESLDVETCNKEDNQILLETIKQESLDVEDLKEEMDDVPNQPDTQITSEYPSSHSANKNTVSISTQTDNFGQLPDIKYLLKNTFHSPPERIDEAVDRMFQIDKVISELNEYRQSIFSSFISRNNRTPKVQKREHLERFVSYSKKARQDSEVSLSSHESLSFHAAGENESDAKNSHKLVQEKRCQNFGLHEKVLSTRVDGDRLLAATESGKLYIFDLSTMTELKCISVSEKPVIAVTSVKDEHTREILAATFDNAVRVYDARRMKLIKMLNTESIVQCMDEKWEYVFMGTSNGYLMRYSLKKNDIEFEEKFNEDCIVSLKAISEGARKVLLVGAKEAPVCFRDAITGLHLRTLQHNSPTSSVFSIIVDVNIYCATDNHVQVFSFHEGSVMHILKAESMKQINCIRLFKKLLFASCENGYIYIYATTQNSKVGCIEGPGGSILSMEVVDDKNLATQESISTTIYNTFRSQHFFQIFVGTSLIFKVIPIPEGILNLKW